MSCPLEESAFDSYQHLTYRTAGTQVFSSKNPSTHCSAPTFFTNGDTANLPRRTASSTAAEVHCWRVRQVPSRIMCHTPTTQAACLKNSRNSSQRPWQRCTAHAFMATEPGLCETSQRSCAKCWDPGTQGRTTPKET